MILYDGARDLAEAGPTGRKAGVYRQPGTLEEREIAFHNRDDG